MLNSVLSLRYTQTYWVLGGAEGAEFFDPLSIKYKPIFSARMGRESFAEFWLDLGKVIEFFPIGVRHALRWRRAYF